MPIRRLFGLLVCALSLLSTPVLAQTVSFVDESGAPAATYVEKSRVHLRVADPSANASVAMVNTVVVTLTTALSGDSEVLTLTETGVSTGVFTGSMALDTSAGPPYQGAVLETALQAGPPVVRDTLTAVYSPTVTDTAAMVGARIQLLDDRGRPAVGYTENDWVNVRVEDHVLYNDPGIREGVTVAVFVFSVSDEEFIVLQETGNATGIYEGRIPAVLHATNDDDGVVGAPVGNLVQGQYAVSDAQEHVDVQVPLLGSRSEILDAAGEPADFVAESSTIRLRAVDRLAGGPGIVDTVQAGVFSEIGLDEEVVTLFETGTDSGVFEAELPTSIDPTVQGNGTLETAEDAGPPHRFDTITLSYPDSFSNSTDTAVTYGSETLFVDAYGNEADSYAMGSTLYIRVIDHNYAQNDSVLVTLQSTRAGDIEIFPLWQTDMGTGIFEGSMPIRALPNYVSLDDNELQAFPVDTIQAMHTDALGNTASGDLAEIYYGKLEFFDEQGRPTQELVEGGLARVRLYGAQLNTSIYDAEQVQVQAQSALAGDSEPVTLVETGTNTGVFEGTLPLAYSYGGAANGNGTLETTNGGSPGYAQDTVTVQALDASASAVTVGARVWLIDGFGADAASFAVGDTVGVRVEDHNVDDPEQRQTLQAVIVVNSQADEVESVNLLETGYATGVFEGLIPSRPDLDGTVNDGTLDIQQGDLVQARHSWSHAPSIATDDALVTGASIRFVDAEGRSAESYLESSTAYVRLVYAAGNTSSGADSVDVTVSAAISEDVEMLTLTETGADTGIFTGSLDMRYGSSSPGDGFLQILRNSSVELDTLTVTHNTVNDTASLTGSRLWFVDAAGNPAASYAQGSRVYIRVEDHSASQPGILDTVYATLSGLGMGDYEYLALAETAPESGIFEGSIAMEAGPGTYAQPYDGDLQTGAPEQIEATYSGTGGGGPAVRAQVTFGSVDFVDEAGAVTLEVVEGGLARLRVFLATGNPFDVTVQSLYGDDTEEVFLTETAPGSHIFEGTIQLGNVPEGGGVASNGLLETSTSGSPEYLQDELTAHYGDATAEAVTVPSRVSFFDNIGGVNRTTTTFAVGERVGVRVEDHSFSNPLVREQFQVLVHEVGSGDAEYAYLIETGYDTDVYEGTLESEDGPVFNDGKLQVAPGRTIAAERLNTNSPHPTVAQATMTGASVIFVDAEGRPAEAYFERTRAYVRVADTFASGSITVNLQSFLVEDRESLTLTETGPSTGVFVGSIPLSPGGGGSTPDNGYLETGQLSGPPHRRDTLTASYASVYGTVSATAGMIGSRVSFIDAYGGETDGYAAGTTAYLRVEDHVAGAMPGYYDTLQVTLSAPDTGDTETVMLRETTRESGIFEGSVRLEKEDQPPSPSPNDGKLQSMAGEEIEAVYDEPLGDGIASDEAVIRYASAMFVDEAGEPTGQVLENGVARLRVVGSFPQSEINVELQSLYGEDGMLFPLLETFPGSQVYEGAVQLSFVPPGGNGSPGNGVLETSNSGAPDYLGDELTLTYQDAEATAVTIPSRVSFFDSYGRTTTTFAVGERVGVRVQDHNLANPLIREQIQVLVHEVGSGDAESVYLIETGYDTDVYQGTLASADGPAVSTDGTLQVAPGRTIAAERLNQHSPYPTVAQATMAGASVVFVDAEGRPAESYFEATEAHVRVLDTFASGSITATLQSFLGLDSESLTLTETGPSTGVFEGSIPLSPGGGGTPNNGYLETGQFSGPPHERDTLTASYPSISGTVSDTVGMIGSRLSFIDAYGNETDSYTAGTTAYIRVEDHVAASMPGHYDTLQVTLSAPDTGDTETVTLRETTRESHVLEGSVRLEKEDYPPTPSPNDGKLQSMPGEEIDVVYDEPLGDGMASDTAVIRFASAEFVDEAGEPTNEVLENGVAHLRVVGSSPGSSITVTVTSNHGDDQENVTLTETFSGSQVYEGTLQLSFVPPGNGSPNSGVLDASNSGAPDYLGDGLTVTYQDAEGTAVTIPSRVSFFDSYGRAATTFAVGERVGVRVQDHNLRNPLIREQFQVLVHEVGSGDAQTVYLLETGYDTDVYQGTLATADGPPVSEDGTLQVAPGRQIAAERLNQHTPYPTVARATMTGAAVVFVDAEGQAAEVYYERTRAYVRVSDTFASGSITVTLQSLLGLDSESLTLAETGPSTGVFEGSIPLTTGGGNPNNGYLETAQFAGPPNEHDVLTASYESIAGTVTDTAGMIGSRTWFVDAYGNETDSYTAGTTAYIRVEDHVAGSMPGFYDTLPVTLSAPDTGDTETTILRETTRESGIFEGSVRLEKEDYPPTPSPNDGKLQSMPGEEIEVAYDEPIGGGITSDTAAIRFASAEFVDEAGEPTNEVLENGVARLRVSSASPGSSITVTVTSSRGDDQEIVTLTETSSGSQVYEGSVQLSFVPQGNGSPNNGVLDASNSGAPDYLGDGLTLTYQDAEGTAVTIPSRVSFFDSYGRTTSTFAVGERVGVRVQDHNLKNPLIREQFQVLVHEVGSGDAQTVYLLETGYDTDVYQGTLATADGPPVSEDGTLQVAPGRTIAANRLNQHTPYPTVAHATMTGASVVFVDAEGRPAELYYERTTAYVRVSDAFASGSITVTLQSFLGLDSESLTLTQTSLGVFEGSIPLSLNSGTPNNGYLETGQYSGPPHEYDVLTASYESIAGTVSDTAGTIGSRTWFVDAYGNETDSYTAGTTAYIRVEDHIAGSMPNHYDTLPVTLNAPATGDTETVILRETTRESGIFEGSVSLEKEDYPPTPSPNDGRLQSMPGEEIDVVHDEYAGDGTSSDTALIRFASAEFVDEAGEPTSQVLENGVARLRVSSASPGSSITVTVTSSRGDDQEIVTLTETSSGSQVYEGSVPLSFVPPGNGSPNSGVLDASNSGAPDYLGDGLTVAYQDAEGTAVTIPSRVSFFDSYGRTTTTFAVGERVGVRVQDHNLKNPLIREQLQELVHEVGSGDGETVYLLETGYDTNVYEGTLATADGPPVSGDGTLQVAPGRTIAANRLNQHTPYPTVAHATMTGASVVFVDAEGQAAEVYFEKTRAYVRVSDTFASGFITATVRSFLTADSETVGLTETGPSTGVFEGSIALATNSANPNNGILETGRFAGPPQEFDTLTASYGSIAGTVSDTAGTVGSRTSFIDMYGNETDSYAAGSNARVRVRDHNFDQPEVNDTVYVTLRSLTTGDLETVAVYQVVGEGIFEAIVPLDREDYPPSPVPNDGRLQSMPGEEIEVVHTDLGGGSTSSDLATISYSEVLFLDPTVDGEGEVLENGTAYIQVTDTSATSGFGVVVRSRYAEDEENVFLSPLGQGVYRDVVQLAFVPPGGATPNNGVLETSNSGAPEYLQDELTADHMDAEGRAVTVPSRIGFLGWAEDWPVTEYAVGSTIRVRVQDQNANDPTQVDTTAALLTSPGGDAESITLTEIYAEAGIFWGLVESSDTPGAPQDGNLTAGPNTKVTVQHLNVHSSRPTTVQLPINGNFAPEAVADAVETEPQQMVVIDVLANDTDRDQEPLGIAWIWPAAHGSVGIVANKIEYMPDPEFVGTDTFSYVAGDPRGGQSRGTVTVTVIQPNLPPLPQPDDVTLAEDGAAVAVDVLANDEDPEGDPLEVTLLLTQPLLGTAALQPDDTILYTPNPNAHGSDNFTYQVEDPDGATATALVFVTVTPVNDPPVANDDTATAPEDGSATVTVLANDTDVDNDTLDVTAVTQGTNGAVVLNANETATYTPAANFHGTDSFTYTVSDGNGGTDTATVTVTVTPANDAPVANDDTATVAEESSVTVNVLGNDTDAENDTLEVTAVTQGTNGSVTLDPVTYTPNANFHGADSFTYTVSDGNGGTDTATVTVTVTPVNDAPVAIDDTASVVEDGSTTVNVLGNDTDADNDTLTVTAVTQGTNGAVTLDPVTYTPSPNFFGTDSFTYTMSDGNGGTDTATVTVTIAPSNDNLTANDDSATVTEDGSVTVAVLGNDSDPENDVLSVQSVTQGTNGSVAIAGTQVTYTPNADFHGADSFTYTASDGNGGTDSATVTITVTPVNDAPVAGDDTASVVEDGSVAVTVLGNDADVDDDLLSVISVTQGAHGTVVINGDDTVTYTPEANYNGGDSFTYTISDGNGGEDTATVTVTVSAANDAPAANDDSASTSEDNPVTVAVLGNDTDPENDTLTVSAVTQGTNGSVTLNPVTYTPNANFHGTDSFTYTVSDGNGGTDTATVNVTVNPVNDAPVANDDPASVAEDGSVTVTVLANDTDADDDTLTVTAVTQGAHGTVTLNPVTYTPVANYNGADSFTYTISDGNGGTDTATVNVTVGAANDAPAANDDTATVAEDGSVTIPVLANDTDLDNDTLTVISVTQPANGTVTMNPVTYTPNANFNGTNSFTYTISDGNGGTDTATVTVTVTAVNDAPVAVNDTAATIAEVPVTIQVRTNDTDVEGNTLTITAVTQGAHGAVAINAGQTVTYTPATAWVGPDSFTYTISDGNGGTATATVDVNVQAPPRVTANIQVLYPFNEGSGTTVNDTSGVGTPLNLTVANASAVTWLPGALSINANTLVQSAGTATKVINASKASNEVTVEAWVDPLNLTQTGPAAIVTISQTNTKRDVTLGQSATAYTGQLRTSTTGQDGTQHTASNVATTNLTHVVYTRSSTGAVRIYVNGTQAATGTLTGNLSGWANYNLALGGELSGTRYWRGELHLVAIYSRALTSTEVRQNWLAGAN